MTKPYLSVRRIERKLATGDTEELLFSPGVNVLVGRPNTGKTKWLETLDYLLGDPDQNPFEGAEETGLAEKYDAAGAELKIGEESVRIERRWRQPAAKTKVFVSDADMSARDFQHWLMEKLGIPLLNFPKGNPMSGQTWPELSFRMLLRHIYRQQRFWGDLADKQPEAEQHACLLQFLGLAENLFTEEYGELIQLKMESDNLRLRREQYGQTLSELAGDLLAEPGLTVGISAATISAAEERLRQDIESMQQRRVQLLSAARERAVPEAQRGHIEQLGERRADSLAELERLRRRAKAVAERLSDLQRYRLDLTDELERMSRAADAGSILADLKITHCPACDQLVREANPESGHCFLCHQDLPSGPMVEGLGAVRLRFEQDRINGEIKEADQLLATLEKQRREIAKDIVTAEEKLHKIESQLAPARQAVSALVQDEVSAVDMELGEVHERQRHISRVSAALKLGEELTEKIEGIEKRIAPLQARVDEVARATDFDAAAAWLEQGMNAYLNAINLLRPNVWRHNPVRVDISRSGFAVRVGSRRWSAALGGTDTLYFLMAYHYGLLSLSNKAKCHYPGLSIIDVPGEFSGEAVEDKENFIVQPFIDLLRGDEFGGAQLIISGASFSGLERVHRRELKHVYVS